MTQLGRLTRSHLEGYRLELSQLQFQGKPIFPVGVLQGSAPNRVQSMVFEWAALRQEDLLENWERARRAERLLPIAPLP